MLEITTPAQTMTSLEIATLVDSRHDKVKQSIERLVERGAISKPPAGDGPKSANGVVTQVYLIGKRDSYVIVAQLSPEFTARLVDRWQELEEQARNPVAALSRLDLLKLAMDSEEKRLALEHKVEALIPKAEALDRFATFAEGSMCITNAAKALQQQPKAFFRWLQEHEWIYRRAGGSGWIGYQSRIQVGYLEHKVTTVERGDGSEKVVEQVLITAKGLAKLSEHLTIREAA